MKYAVDWARSRTFEVLKSGSEKAETMTVPQTYRKFEEGDIVIIENSCSQKILNYWQSQGVIIYEAHAKSIHDLRGELGFPEKKSGSDKEDTKLIMKAFEKHPELFTEREILTEEEKKKILLGYEYRALTKDSVRFKNRGGALEWSLGDNPYKESAKILDDAKEKILKESQKLYAEEYEKLQPIFKIKGMGWGFMFQLLSEAHPANFSNLSSFLGYVGCKGHSFYKEINDGNGKGRGSFSRSAKAVIWNIANALMRGRGIGKTYYDKVKEDLRANHPDYSKGKIHGMTLNRLQTWIAKKIYQALTNKSTYYQEELFHF